MRRALGTMAAAAVLAFLLIGPMILAVSSAGRKADRCALDVGCEPMVLAGSGQGGGTAARP